MPDRVETFPNTFEEFCAELLEEIDPGQEAKAKYLMVTAHRIIAIHPDTETIFRDELLDLI